MELELDVAKNCLFRKVRVLSRNIESSYAQNLTPFGLTPAQFTLLSAIKLLDEASINKLSEATQTDRTTLNRNLKPLIDKRYIGLEESSDKRKKVLELLPHGQEVYVKVYTQWQETQNSLKEKLGSELWNKLNEVLDEVNLTTSI